MPPLKASASPRPPDPTTIAGKERVQRVGARPPRSATPHSGQCYLPCIYPGPQANTRTIDTVRRWLACVKGNVSMRQDTRDRVAARYYTDDAELHARHQRRGNVAFVKV